MSAHTPGPWEIEPSDDGSNHWIRPVAGVGSGWVGDRYMTVSGHIDIHDARLIAAAPDLLDACQRLLVEVRWEAMRADEVTDQARADIALAEAAIAKATGSAA